MGNKSSKARARSSAATAAAANAEPVSARDLGARDLGARARDLAKPAFVRDFAIPDRLGGMTAATISAVGAAVQTWNSAKDNSTVHGLIAFVTNAVPAFAATLGALGEHAPLVGVVFSVLKVAGAYVADVAATKAAYETFAAAVITTTRLVLEVEEFQRAEQATLPGPVTSALNLYWAQLDTFAALLVQFRGKNYAKRLFGKGAHQTQLNVVRIATEQAARDLDRTGILTSVVQNELILANTVPCAVVSGGVSGSAVTSAVFPPPNVLPKQNKVPSLGAPNIPAWSTACANSVMPLWLIGGRGSMPMGPLIASYFITAGGVGYTFNDAVFYEHCAKQATIVNAALQIYQVVFAGVSDDGFPACTWMLRDQVSNALGGAYTSRLSSAWKNAG